MKAKVKKLGERFKIFAMFALLGFMAGIIAKATYQNIIPWILANFPTVGLDWILSGFAGALLTIGLVMAWAYISGATNQEK
jgi:lipid-A-disaccharide synthase-like uncharacterized protein